MLATSTQYPRLDTEGKRSVFALFAEADDSSDCNIHIILSFIKMQLYDMKMLRFKIISIELHLVMKNKGIWEYNTTH